ncbi:iron uptake porin [Sodalinema gerasimenkoae]|uniref:iron uptake porin n=1 Tax=Sodalinema gerasimenkoae TaxID=2862348 RepID=UPI00135C816A|nr:iron uptake porin [Sodalinema gerasimenkoae]
MSKLRWTALTSGLSTLSLLALPAIAQGQELSTKQLNGGDSPMLLAQVTSVSQLSDVQPTDWAFQALQSLVERYGCIAGYPDGTFRGNNFMTRYEFAAGLNACLDQIIALVDGGDSLDPSDLATIRRLQEEFSAELSTLRGRVDRLEARTSELEANQFSTTTKLEGEAIFSLYGIATGDNVIGDNIDHIPSFGYRNRLEFHTSFSGRDLLMTRLQSSNIPAFSDVATGYPEGDLFFSDDTGGGVEVDALVYQFPFGNANVVIAANEGAADDFASTVNPFFDGDGGSGALSRFGTRASIYYLMEGSGIGVEYPFGDALSLSAGYFAGDSGNPSRGAGLFNGPYGAMAQLTFTPSDRAEFALTYVNAYNQEMNTGSVLNNVRRFTGDIIPTVSNAYGFQGSFQVSDNFALGGWVGYVNTQTLSTLGQQINRGTLESWNWAVTLAFPDLLLPGNLAGIIVGQEPKITGNRSGLRQLADGENFVRSDPDTSLHVEAFYSLQVSENLTITPGLIWLTAPNHNANNDDALIGVVRTTFSF